MAFSLKNLSASFSNFFNNNGPIWTKTEKTLFRFCCIFFSLNIIPSFLPFPIGDEWLTRFIGRTIFGIQNLVRDPLGGSGDSQFDWVGIFSILLISLIATLIWSVLDRKRRSYNQLKFFLDVIVQYFLIFNMLTYGFSKVFAQQMPAPSENRLWQHVGDMSPMGILWTFIGSSSAYQIFCGAVEVLAGVLLLFRRTFLLGTLVAFLTMLQIFVLNMCYDVPVKIFSFFLVACSLYLAAPFFAKLYHFFIANKTTEPFVFYEISTKKWSQTVSMIVKTVIVFAMLFIFYQDFGGKEVLDKPNSLAFEGSYIIDNAPQKLAGELFTNVSIRDNYGRKMFSATNEELGTRKRWFYIVNDTTKMLKLSPIDKKDSVVAVLNYAMPDSMHIVLKGLWAKDSVSINAAHRPKRDFLLVKRGFHWINNEPFNR